MKSMKVVGIFVIGLLVTLSLASFADATPPRYLKVQYQVSTNTITFL